MKKSASEVAKRYANALFELASEQNATQKIVEEARALEPYLPIVSEVLMSPVFSEANKIELLNILIDGVKIGNTLGNTLRLVLRNRRFSVLSHILKEFFDMVDASMGIARGTLAAARPVDAAVLAEFEKDVVGSHRKKVQLVAHVEESLRAGYVVEVEGTVIDASLKTRLKNLRESLSRGV